jgi:hypothetical protein
MVEGKTAFEICWLGSKQRKGYILRIAREENEAIVLSVLLQFTDSDYPFGIFKLFV